MIENTLLFHYPYKKIKDIVILNEPYEKLQWNNEKIKIAFVFNPYIFFDMMLKHWIEDAVSHLFSADMLRHIKNMEPLEFLTWLDKQQIIPLYNPQTFQFSLKKDLQTAIDHLERFDYVLPEGKESILFTTLFGKEPILEHEISYSSYFQIETYKDHPIVNRFLEKDILLYERAKDLFKEIEEHNFASLGSFLVKKEISGEDEFNCQGVVDKISSSTISGWAVIDNSSESPMIEIYKNHKKLYTGTAEMMRAGVKAKGIHPTGKCGFHITFDDNTFSVEDNIEVKIVSTDFSLPLGKEVKAFFNKV